MYYAHHSTTSIQSTSIHSWSLLKYVAKERAPRARADTRVLEANLHTHLTPNQSYLDSILFTTDYYDSIEREKENHPLSIHWPHSSISLCFHSPFERDVPRFLTNSSRFAHFLTDSKSDEFAATIFGVVADVWMDGSC